MRQDRHSSAPLLALASLVLAVSLAMSAVSAWQRAGTELDRALLVAMSCTVVLAVHLLPAVVRSRWRWPLWALAFVVAVYGHASFLAFAAQKAAEARQASSAQVKALQARESAIREALAAIEARPVAVVGAQLARARTEARAAALQVEMAEAQRAAVMRDQLVTVAAELAQLTATEGMTDPVTHAVARVTGLSGAAVTLVVHLVMAITLELIGAVLWVAALRPTTAKKAEPEAGPVPVAVPATAPASPNTPAELPHPAPAIESRTESPPDPLASLRAAIERGEIRPTVSQIRAFLACSQGRAAQVRRELVGQA